MGQVEHQKHGPQKPKEIEQEDGKPSEDTLGKLQIRLRKTLLEVHRLAWEHL